MDVARASSPKTFARASALRDADRSAFPTGAIPHTVAWSC